jgi:hypothetical protein
MTRPITWNRATLALPGFSFIYAKHLRNVPSLGFAVWT